VALYEPATHGSLAALLAEHEEAVLLAGGTQLMRRLKAAEPAEETVISLRGIESMARISRSQRFIDIGSMVTLSRILSIGPNVIPESLFAALKIIATPSGILDVLRVAFSLSPTGVHRLPAVEAESSGSRLPLRGRTVDSLEGVARGELAGLRRPDAEGLEEAGAVVLRLLRWFLSRLVERRGSAMQRALQRPGGGAILP
jgi:hypothetical protein